MILTRLQFFLLLLAIAVTPFAGRTLWWLAHSKKVAGVMWYKGKSYTGQLPHEYSAIKFIVGKDTAWFNTNDNIIFKPGEIVQVRYQPTNLYDAKVDMFVEIWGDAVVYGGELTLIVLIIFLHPAIVPRKSKIRISASKPFLQTIYTT